MTDQPSSEELNFERAQYDQPGQGAAACHQCRGPLGHQYYSLNGHGVCDACLAKARLGQQSSFPKALGLGALAGAAGAAVYYGITELTGYNLALITIVVGIMVGIAVRRGAGGSRSMVYRVMAIGLTYVAMCATYVPMIAAGITSGAQTDAEVEAGEAVAQTGSAPSVTTTAAPAEPRSRSLVLAVASVMALAVPFFLISETEVLALLIFGFGLWEAWRLSAPRPFVVEGPFASSPTSAIAAAPPPA